MSRPGQRGGGMLTMLEVHPSLSSGQAEPSVTEDESSKLGTAESVSAADVRRTRPGRPSNPPPEEGRARLTRRGRASGPPAQPGRRAASPPAAERVGWKPSLP